MTHSYFQNQFACAVDAIPGDATKLKEELDEDRVVVLFSFPVDQ